MKIIRKEFKEEIEAAQQFLDYIQGIEEREIQHMMYSSVILILYNIIESTVTQVLIRIHDEVSLQHKEGLKYHDFNDCIKTVIYKCNRVGKSSYDFKFSELSSMTIKDFVPGDEYAKKRFNGNIDAKKIEEILEDYGVDRLHSELKKDLLSLKMDRQKLAHGNQTFKEYGQRTSIEDIKRYFFATEETLSDVINNVELYIEEKLYLEK